MKTLIARPNAPPTASTRQQKRLYYRTVAMNQINRMYGPEPRKARRRMALRIACQWGKSHAA
jgi:hypothetical protein